MFADMSMLSYQRMAPEIKAICEKHGVPYIQVQSTPKPQTPNPKSQPQSNQYEQANPKPQPLNPRHEP
jgi:hypothetical protein